MFDQLLNVFLVLTGFGFLIFIHELGHFMAARACGVRCEAFSIGFGPVILKWQGGDTQYRLSIIPLGGYVKMAGESRDESDGQGDELYSKNVWQRLLIYSAGVIMNVITAFVFFLFAFQAGIDGTSPVIGHVLDKSPAQEAGLQVGDRVLELDGWDVHSFEEILQGVMLGDDEGVHLKVQSRDGNQRELTVYPQYYEEIGASRIGVEPLRRGLKVMSEKSPLHGVVSDQSYEDIVAVGRESMTPVFGASEFIKALQDLGQGEVRLHVEKDGQIEERVFNRGAKNIIGATFENGPAPDTSLWGRFVSFIFGQEPVDPLQQLRIAAVMDDGPAAGAGLRAGDRIVAITPQGQGRQELSSFEEMRSAIQASDQLTVHIARIDGVHDINLQAKQVPSDLYLETEIAHEEFQESNWLAVGRLGWMKSLSSLQRIVQSLGAFITGKVDASRYMGGPVLILQASSERVKKGTGAFLSFLALISFNLAVINILPIPVFDGGHIFLMLIEAARGRPVPDHVFIGIQYVGLVLILTLFVTVFYWDITRAWP